MPSPALAHRAEAAGAHLPPLVVEAERVAATVMGGVHGRRRAGQGDSFWQFRPYLPGDAASRVDWRQSAKADRLYVRETEWEAAQTVLLWRDGGPRMGWRSHLSPVTKAERADLLLLALAALLLRGGERVKLARAGARPFSGRRALAALAAALPGPPAPPAAEAIPRHGRIVLFGDFLDPLEETRALLAALSARSPRGQIVQVMDPAEETLPYAGRRRFEGLAGEAPMLLPRVEAVRGLYAERLAAHRAGLRQLAGQLGWGFATHRTDQPPAAVLLALWQALSPP
ncbi:MAG: DUF58 domain-containing protein [Rhodovarius sp.]|nr:DUF58 domain-containing protein [Rhodovarius sp.]MCX7932928.1 DUF58 domain-containing protein [Rhodovarius sp.]MDW8313464.1 DUF58 domain-containing protein [Rhodovarius sp.]